MDDNQVGQPEQPSETSRPVEQSDSAESATNQQSAKREWFTFHFANGQLGTGGIIGRHFATAIWLCAAVSALFFFVQIPRTVLGWFSPQKAATITSCLGDAAQKEAERQFKDGQISREQYSFAITCKLQSNNTDPKNFDGLNGAIKRLFDRSEQADLVELLSKSGEAAAAERLSSDPSLHSLDDLKALGLLLFGIDANGSIRAYERALTVDPNDPDVLNRLGQLYDQQENFAKAEAVFLRIIQGQNVEPIWRARALNNLGGAYADKGDLTNARLCYTQAVEIFDRLGKRLSVARGKSNIAQIDLAEFRKTKRKELLVSARSVIEESMAIFQTLQIKPDIAISYQQLGMADLLSGHARSAKQNMEKALNLFSELQDTQGVILSRGMLGEIELDLGDQDAAQAAFAAERTEAEKQDMPDETATAWAGLGRVAHARGQKTLACSLFQQAFAVWSAAHLKTDESDDALKAAGEAGCVRQAS